MLRPDSKVGGLFAEATPQAFLNRMQKVLEDANIKLASVADTGAFVSSAQNPIRIRTTCDPVKAFVAQQ